MISNTALSYIEVGKFLGNHKNRRGTARIDFEILAQKTRVVRKDKGKGVGESSGEVGLGYDNEIFSSLEAQEQYPRVSQHTLISERKVEFPDEEGEHEIFYEIKRNIMEREWMHYMQKVEPENLSTVFEFYTNPPDLQDGGVFVRKKQVRFYLSEINTLLRSPTPEGQDEYQQWLNSYDGVDYQEVANVLCF